MKIRKLILPVMVASAVCNFTAVAGQWLSDSNGWRYLNDNGTYFMNSCEWIDGNYDGIAECYYFDGTGYCLINTITPDGHYVNENGAWMEDGIVKTKSVASSDQNATVLNNQKYSIGKSLASLNYRTFDNGMSIADGTSWESGFYIFDDGGYVTFGTDKHNIFNATLGVEIGTPESHKSKIVIYGNDIEKIYESQEFTYSSEPIDISINVGSYDRIKIVLEGTTDFVPATIMFKNVCYTD